MASRRLAQLPLHGGKAPPWLFRRMTRLAEAITMAIVEEFGPQEMLKRLSDPWWFQAFGCVLGFDWHSSGLTTVTCGALKEAYRHAGGDLGICVAGGKGAASRKTPGEIAEACDQHAVSSGDALTARSRLTAKVDSAAVQDHFTLYHHAFFFTHTGDWCVVQQGMNEALGAARRYHWLSAAAPDPVCEPHFAIDDLARHAASPSPPRSASKRNRREPPGQLNLFDDPQDEPRPAPCSAPRQRTLNLVALEGDGNRRATCDLLKLHPDELTAEIERLTEGPTLFAPQQHRVLPRNVNPARLKQLVPQLHEAAHPSFQAVLGADGVGPAAIRSLSLIAEVIFQKPVSYRDPSVAPPCPPHIEDEVPSHPRARRWADYSYAHGGKDKTPFPVDCETYDRNIELLTQAVRSAKIGDNDRFQALKTLHEYQRRRASA